jgi:hypothetical protein
VEEAKKFEPPLESFYVVTSSPRDANIQAVARNATIKNQQNGLFQVHVWGWEDVQERLAQYPDLLRLHYPQFFGQAPSATAQTWVMVGFATDTGISDTLRLAIPHIAIDLNQRESEVEAKRRELLDTHTQAVNQHRARSVMTVIHRPNPRFEEELNAFLEQYREYLASRDTHRYLVSRIISIGLATRNDGPAAADDVVLELKIPRGLRQLTDEECLQWRHLGEPEEPSPPRVWALGIMDTLLTARFPGTSLLFPNLPPSISPPSNIQGPKFGFMGNVPKVTYEISRLLPGRVETTAKFHLFAEDECLNRVNEFPITLYGANISVPQSAIIRVELTLADRS